MIRPRGVDGVAFSEAADGDQRSDESARRQLCASIGISSAWATVRQIHGDGVVRVEEPGPAGDADALWTEEPGLPLAVFTADCFGVVLQAGSAVGVAHAGWRGVDEGLVAKLRATMGEAGFPPDRAFVGPGIRDCCFEVGDDVANRFPFETTTTSWGTPSVDLCAALSRQLEGVTTWSLDRCTHHDHGWFSHRRDQTPSRLATIGWRP